MRKTWTHAFAITISLLHLFTLSVSLFVHVCGGFLFQSCVHFHYILSSKIQRKLDVHMRFKSRTTRVSCMT